MKIKVGELRRVIGEELERRLLREFVREAKLSVAAKPGMKKPPEEEEETNESEDGLSELRSLIGRLLIEINVRKLSMMVQDINQRIGTMHIGNLQDVGPDIANDISQVMKMRDMVAGDDQMPEQQRERLRTQITAVVGKLVAKAEERGLKLGAFISASERTKPHRTPMAGRRREPAMPTAKRRAMKGRAA